MAILEDKALESSELHAFLQKAGRSLGVDVSQVSIVAFWLRCSDGNMNIAAADVCMYLFMFVVCLCMVSSLCVFFGYGRAMQLYLIRLKVMMIINSHGMSFKISLKSMGGLHFKYPLQPTLPVLHLPLLSYSPPPPPPCLAPLLPHRPSRLP